MKSAALIMALLLAVCSSWAATITTSDNTQAALVTALASASDGDKIVVDTNAGTSVTWSTATTITKGVWIDFQNLNITDGVGSTKMFEIGPNNATNIYFYRARLHPGSASGGTTGYLHLNGNSSVKNILVSDCMFFGKLGTLADALKFERNGVVIWNCGSAPEDGGTNAYAFGVGWFHIEEGGAGIGDITNRTVFGLHTLGTADTGGTNNIYIEDCTFTNAQQQCIDFDNLSRTVVRYSYFKDCKITMHGVETSYWGCNQFEIYNSEFRSSGTVSLDHFIWQRGGYGLLVDNIIDDINDAMNGNVVEIIHSTINCLNTSSPNADTRCITLPQYPTRDLVGTGWNGSTWAVEKVYYNNTAGNGSPQMTPSNNDGDGSGTSCGNGLTTGDFLKAGRDWTNGVYRAGYTKYTYPHPDRANWVGGGGGGGGGGSSSSAPGRQKRQATSIIRR